MFLARALTINLPFILSTVLSCLSVSRFFFPLSSSFLSFSFHSSSQGVALFLFSSHISPFFPSRILLFWFLVALSLPLSLPISRGTLSVQVVNGYLYDFNIRLILVLLLSPTHSSLLNYPSFPSSSYFLLSVPASSLSLSILPLYSLLSVFSSFVFSLFLALYLLFSPFHTLLWIFDWCNQYSWVLCSVLSHCWQP